MSSDTILSAAARRIRRELDSDPHGTCRVCGATKDLLCDEVVHRRVAVTQQDEALRRKVLGERTTTVALEPEHPRPPGSPVPIPSRQPGEPEPDLPAGEPYTPYRAPPAAELDQVMPQADYDAVLDRAEREAQLRHPREVPRMDLFRVERLYQGQWTYLGSSSNQREMERYLIEMRGRGYVCRYLQVLVLEGGGEHQIELANDTESLAPPIASPTEVMHEILLAGPKPLLDAKPLRPLDEMLENLVIELHAMKKQGTTPFIHVPLTLERLLDKVHALAVVMADINRRLRAKE